MAQEIEALELNNTWVIVDLPPDRKPINCKWVYKAKYNAEGSLEMYKARLVIRGDKQVEGFALQKLLLPLPRCLVWGVFLPLQLSRSGNSIKWMSIILFCMVICMKRFT